MTLGPGVPVLPVPGLPQAVREIITNREINKAKIDLKFFFMFDDSF